MLLVVADKLGGERADRLRAALKKGLPFDDVLSRAISDEEFSSLLTKMERDLPNALSQVAKWDILDNLAARDSNA